MEVQETTTGAGLSKKVRRCVHLAAWIGLVATAPVAVTAQTVERPMLEEAEEAISELRSPYCPGFMLEVCPSPQAQALRDSIYDLAAQGASSEEIVEWMIGNHGEEWRGLPRRSGAGLLAWVIPPIALLLGVGAIVGWYRATRRKEDGVAEPEAPAISDAERQKLSMALREWEETGHEEV